MNPTFPIVLVLFGHPVPQKQLGTFEFQSKTACEQAAPDIERLNRTAYPAVHFDRFACLNTRDDLP